uniref:Uncharacterized protein n=1 Tax=viral metagenome TaxID=1070528 RepID=A0A6C0C642_9ZZZZ
MNSEQFIAQMTTDQLKNLFSAMNKEISSRESPNVEIKSTTIRIIITATPTLTPKQARLIRELFRHYGNWSHSFDDGVLTFVFSSQQYHDRALNEMTVKRLNYFLKKAANIKMTLLRDMVRLDGIPQLTSEIMDRILEEFTIFGTVRLHFFDHNSMIVKFDVEEHTCMVSEGWLVRFCCDR